MTRDRIVQSIALLVAIVSTAGAGLIIPRMIEQSDRNVLKYTDVSVEGAPPIVALSTAVGVLRGIVVDYLWIKIHIQQEKGQYYEVMADADLLTKLQPRFGAVWMFHGHNMAYNISVVHNTEEERWEWVKEGIRLVRNDGIRYNPNNIDLYRELAFWLAHKVDGYSDDANIYYKTEFAREWHYLLGEPPLEHEAQVEKFAEIVNAPSTLDALIQQMPRVELLVDRLRNELEPFEQRTRFELDSHFLSEFAEWQAVVSESAAAEMTGMEDDLRETSKFFITFDEIAADPAFQDEWEALIAHVRKRVLLDEYNMEPDVMLRFMRELQVPFDWRHPQTHSVYWSRLGTERAELRASDQDNIYRIVNNDRIQIQAMQALARSGRIVFDPFSRELPARLPQPAWTDPIIDMFEHLVAKHYETRGAGSDTFIGFYENFISSMIRQFYREGQRDKAQELLTMMNNLFGPPSGNPDAKYAQPLDVFIREEIKGQITSQPYLAQADAAAALRYGFRQGIGRDRPEIWQHAVNYAREIIRAFRESEDYGYDTAMGTMRVGDLTRPLSASVVATFLQVMTDPTIPLDERATIWANMDKYEPELRAIVYPRVMPQLTQQFANHPASQRLAVDDLFPAPPNLEEVHRRLREAQFEREEQRERQRARDEAAREGA